MNKSIEVSFECEDYLPLDTTMYLSSEMTLNIKRNPEIYGKLRTQIYASHNESGVSGVIINVAGQELISDTNGYIATFIPLESQRVKYVITSSLPLQTDTIRMPSGEDDVLLVK